MTNPVMMMDDHKSGKRATPTQPRGANAASSSSAAKRSTAGTAAASTKAGSIEDPDNADNTEQQEYDDDQDDMDQDEDAVDDQDEIDLEAGHHIPNHNFSREELKSGDSEIMSGDVLTPLSSTVDRTGAKRRVDENMMEDIQLSSLLDPSRGPFRRKTSHDVAAGGMGSLSLFSPSALSLASSATISTQSPFMLGSPFAGDEHSNAFKTSFPQAPGTGESFLDQKNIDMFLQTSLSTSPAAQRSVANHRRMSKGAVDHESSMMEFTTFDESMSSPPDKFLASTHVTDTFAAKQEHGLDQSSIPTTSQALATRATFSVPVSDYPSTSIATPTASSNPFNSAGMFSSAFSSTFSAPLNAPTATASLNNAPSMSSSFLDASQMQEFQNFKRQSVLQQKQQQLLMQLQQGVQQQSQRQIETKPVPWTTTADNKDPFWNMKMAMSQTTDPMSSAFIPDSTSLPDEGKKDVSPSSLGAVDIDGYGSSAATFTASAETPLAPKKRGRPRKTAPPTTSEADSPVLTHAAAAARSSSPSPPPLTPSSASTAATAAAQFMLFQQRQQQQLQHHQQQLQQQQKQAILARQKPRIQKLIPSRGPVEGGSEITLLGSGFFPGMVPTFDGVPALDVQYYGPETMICRLPSRNFPGTVIVKAQNPLSALVASTSVSGLTAGGVGKDDANSSDLVRTMTQLFGGPSGVQGSSFLGDDDVGVLFEYEESQGDHDLIALALQVLGMKMNGRVEPPRQVALKIMGTATASNAIMGQGAASQAVSSSQAQLQLSPQMQQLQHLQQQTQQSLLGFAGLQSNAPQQNALSQQAQLQQQFQLQLRQSQPQQQQTQQQAIFGSLAGQSVSTANGSILGTGMLGFGNFMNSMGGSNGGNA
ncbi:hypothetical protein EDD21DRAFT_124650 [Dissophora ornata]|nr:hypothetical protein EDD21DRAFT_124650 [Dissophora ornata]